MVGLTVNTAHLLRNHNSRGTIVGTPDPGNAEAVGQTSEIACTRGQFELLLVDDPRVVVISCGNNWMSSQFTHRPEGFVVLVVLHEPTRRLWAEPNSEHQDEGWEERRSQL